MTEVHTNSGWGWDPAKTLDLVTMRPKWAQVNWQTSRHSECCNASNNKHKPLRNWMMTHCCKVTLWWCWWENVPVMIAVMRPLLYNVRALSAGGEEMFLFVYILWSPHSLIKRLHPQHNFGWFISNGILRHNIPLQNTRNWETERVERRER